MCKCENCEWLEKMYYKYDDELFEEYELWDIFYCMKHQKYVHGGKFVNYRG